MPKPKKHTRRAIRPKTESEILAAPVLVARVNLHDANDSVLVAYKEAMWANLSRHLAEVEESARV